MKKKRTRKNQTNKSAKNSLNLNMEAIGILLTAFAIFMAGVRCCCRFMWPVSDLAISSTMNISIFPGNFLHFCCF